MPGSGVHDIPTVLENSAVTGVGAASDEKVMGEIREIKDTLKPIADGKAPPSQDNVEVIQPKDFLKTVLKDSGKIALKHAKDHGSKYGKKILNDVLRGDLENATETIKQMGAESPKLVKIIGKELGKNALLKAQRLDFFQRRRLLAIPGSGAPEEAMAITAADDKPELSNNGASEKFRFEGASQKITSANQLAATERASKGNVLSSFLKGAAGGTLGTTAAIIGSGLISQTGPRYSCAKNAAPEESSFLERTSRHETLKFLEVGQHRLFKTGHKAAARKGGKKGGFLKTAAAIGGAVAGGALALWGAKKVMKAPVKATPTFRYGTYQTWTDVEACEACSFVWSSVLNKANKWDRDELSNTFDDVCSDQPDIFAGPCKEMREKLNFMVTDLIAYKRVKPVCACADMGPCNKNSIAEGTQHLYGYV